MLAFTAWENDLILDLGLKAKRIKKDTIWSLIVLEIIIVQLNVIAELEQVISGFETKWVITTLERERAYEINNALLLKSKKDIKERKGTLFFFLYFLLATRAKVTSSASGILIVTSISEEDIRIRSRL